MGKKCFLSLRLARRDVRTMVRRSRRVMGALLKPETRIGMWILVLNLKLDSIDFLHSGESAWCDLYHAVYTAIIKECERRANDLVVSEKRWSDA